MRILTGKKEREKNTENIDVDFLYSIERERQR